MKKTVLGLALAALLGMGSAGAVDMIVSKDAPDLTVARARIKAKDFAGALKELMALEKGHQHADVYNLIGFCLRKTNDTTQAATYYRKALDFDADHKSALEYQGELFLQIGQPEKARENLVRLKKLCPNGCEELADLEEAIAASAPKTN
jgi:tetratricopeptide (TPR) repeat protein